MWARTAVEPLIRDVRLSLRILKEHPGFMATVLRPSTATLRCRALRFQIWLRPASLRRSLQ